MRVRPMLQLMCPLDGGPLDLRGGSYVCPHGHSFDRAREGYVNLLAVQDKASRDPGDSREMVAARRRFLETGAYSAIASALTDTIATEIMQRPQPPGSSGDGVTILDAGCGEGYYLAALATALSRLPGQATVHLAGLDISKWAVRAAAGRGLPASLVVASNRRPPLPDASVDIILCVFGFPAWSGFAAVQAAAVQAAARTAADQASAMPTTDHFVERAAGDRFGRVTGGGALIMIDPGPDHLLEMRALIYPEVVRRAARAPVVSPGYALASERPVRSTARLATRAIVADLLAMTPHAHRTNAAGQAALSLRDTLDVTIDVTLRVFRRVAA